MTSTCIYLSNIYEQFIKKQDIGPLYIFESHLTKKYILEILKMSHTSYYFYYTSIINQVLLCKLKY